MRRLFVLFFVSGFPALLYQIVWQRALFSIYGINVESVTVVVSAFMLGLGLGSLGGGWLSTREKIRRLAAFGVIELLIGIFGVFSLDAFHGLGQATAGGGTAVTGLSAFLLVLVPTTLMGATLPLLTAYLVERSGNVGRSVGVLYFVNTLGSAVACFAAGWVLLGWLGQTGTVRIAAGINVALGLGVLLLARSESRQSIRLHRGDPSARGAIGFGIALALSAVAGFIALSYEILWFRVFSFTSAGSARAFALLLGAYLLGLAFGSIFSRRFCTGRSADEPGALLGTVGRFVIVANLAGFLVAPALALVVTWVYSYAAGLILVVIAAGALGAVLPLLCHLAIPPGARSGQRLGYLYLANILGSSGGSFLTGFVLLDAFSLETITVGLAVVGVGVGATVMTGGSRRVGSALTGVLAAVSLIWLGSMLFDGLYERLHYKTSYDGQRYAELVETKSGVVAVTHDRLVYGGGIYDGQFKTTFESLSDDTNMLFRVYALSAFHPRPRQVLVIGLGSGSWTKVLAAHPQVQRVTVIEINPGYLDVVGRDPLVKSVLDDPAIDIVIDDGRRWLVANPEAKFDAIVMNTTFNWRAHATNLLSVEFLELCREHLLSGGVVYYNTTWHPRVQRTGAVTFRHALRVGNFLAVGEAPLEIDLERWKRVLGEYRVDGKSAFGAQGIEELLSIGGQLDDPARLPTRYVMESRMSLLERTRGLGEITDDNMGTEWDYTRIDSVDAQPHP